MTSAVGIDLSLTATGVASSHGWCELVGQDGILKLPILDRWRALANLRTKIIYAVGRPGLVCIEAPALSRSRGGTFERGWLWYAVVGSLINLDIPVVEVGIGQLKRYATGNGSANKGGVLVAVTKRWPAFDTKGDDNLADAAVLAAIGAELLGSPLAPMPAAQRTVLDGLRIPEGINR